MYLLSKRMRVGHDFLTHFTQYSKFDEYKLSSTVRYQVKNFLQHDAESCVSRNQVEYLEML
jgi:hypothetical protein